MSQHAVSENMHTPTTTGIEIAWGRQLGEGAVRTKNVKRCTKLYGASRQVGVLRKNPFRGGGMDIFWNHTITGSVINILGPHRPITALNQDGGCCITVSS